MRYVFAIVSSVSTLFVLLSWPELSRDRPLIIILVLPVLLSAYYAGMGPGLVATFLCSVEANYYLIPPFHSFMLGRSADAVEWMALVVIGAVASALGGTRRIKRDDNQPISKGILSTERKVQAGYLVALMSLGIVGVISFNSVTRLSEEADRTRHTEEVIATLRLLLSKATDAETAQRGYIITGDEKYLEPHLDARRRIAAEIKHLRKLCVDDSTQSKRTEELASALSERIERTENNIDIRRNQGFAAAQASIATGRGKLLHDRIRAIIGEMVSTEEESLLQRQRAADEATTLTRTVVATGAAFAFCVVVVALFTVQHDFAGRRRAESSLREANLSLETRVRERTAALEQANEVARESESRLQTVTEVAGIGLVLVDEQHRYRYVNRSYLEIFNLAADELIGRHVAEVLPANYESQTRARLDRALSGESVNYELRLPPLPGSTEDRYFAVSYEPGQDRSGKLVVAVLADITTRKRNEEALRESFQETVDLKKALNEHAIFAVTDPQGRITEVNDKFCELSKYSREELVGQDHRLVNSGFHSREFFCNLWKTIGRGLVWQGDIQNKAKDGTLYWVATTIVPFLDANGKPRRFLAIRADVTGRKLAEEARTRLSGIVRSSSDAIIGKTLDGIITSWNGGAEKVFGYSADEAIGQPMLMLFPPERFDEELDILARIARDETVPHFETERIRKDGKRIVVSVTISPVQDSEGRIVGASKIARDVTAQKRLDEERAQLASLIEHSREFIAIADLEGRVTFMNSRARAMIGLRENEDPSSLRFTDYVAPSWQDEFRHRIIPTVRAQGEWQGEMQLCNMQTGAIIDILRSTFMLRDAAGRDMAFATVTRDITEERRAMRALREIEERLHAVTENLSEGLIVSGVDGQLLHWNRAGLEMHGFQSLEEGLRRYTDFAELFELRTFGDEVLEADQWPLARILRGEQLRNVEVRIRYDGGVWEKVFSYSGRIIHDASGKPLAFLAIHDITARSRAVAALQERENQLSIYAEHGPVAVAMLDREMNYLVVSRRWMEDFRLGEDSIVGRCHYEIFPGVSQRWLDIHRRCLAGAIEKSEEDAFQREDGTIECLRWEVRPWHQADGSIGGIIIFSEVVTARKQAEEAVKASEARYRALFEYAPDGIVIVDPKGFYIDANASICRMLGYERSEIIGSLASSIVAPVETNLVEPVLAQIRRHSDHQREWTFRRKDGSSLTAEAIGTMMPDGNVLGMIRDLTERKQAERFLRVLEQEKRSAFEANRLKSEFLANMSHELRTPLNCIIGFGEFLFDEKPGPLNSKQKEYLSDVLNSSTHLLQLINDVLDLAKVEAGKIELRPECFSLPKSIDEVCAVVKGIAQNKRVVIRTDIAPELGQVILDQGKFKQICYNLLANAVKFTDAGGTVDITAAPFNGTSFEVSVRDTGIGIRQADLPRLFREFEQLEVGTGRRVEGTGLGLALTKKLVELQGGQIGVESEFGRGSTFRVVLPANQEERDHG